MIEVSAWAETPWALTGDEAAEISRSGLARVIASDEPGTWLIKTESTVGVALGDGWELRVRPRLDVPQLMFLLGYARDPNGWKNETVGFSVEDDLLGAIAHGFSVHAARALDRGPLRGYLRHEEQRQDVRGRIQFGTQLARSATLPLPVHVAYDDFTENILENRMLATATRLLLMLPRVSPSARGRLRRIRSSLDGVAPLQSWRGAKAPPITRLNLRYAPALRLAEIILGSKSLGTRIGSVRSTTFAFDMNTVFEDFLTTAFRESMRQFGGEVRDQTKERSLDIAGRLRLKPDLTWWRDGSCRAVLDAKYKRIEAGKMAHPDAYQMLAYCLAFDLPRGYLVYAKDSGATAATHAVRNAGVEIIVESIDVEKSPEALLADVGELARRVAVEAGAESES